MKCKAKGKKKRKRRSKVDSEAIYGNDAEEDIIDFL